MGLDDLQKQTQDLDDDGRRLRGDLANSLTLHTQVSNSVREKDVDRNGRGGRVDDFGGPEEGAEVEMNEPEEAGDLEEDFDEPGLTGQDHSTQHDESSYNSQLYHIARNSNSLLSHFPGDSTVSVDTYPQASPRAKQVASTFTPSDRSLPSPNVTDETLDDAYVQFILYCNPTIPLDCDTSELKKAFRLPPKSDGKTFNMYDLLRLIEKLEQKQIKTWTRLATVLGVERKSDQSAQKVQQYAVRLKRWMHAMHIDAFFEYCLGKSHSYFTHIPPQSHQGFKDTRDGVPFEEDLALRALHPENRPKRGRKKAEDKNDDGAEREMRQVKKLILDTSTPTISRPAADHFAFYSANSSSSVEQNGIGRYTQDGPGSSSWSTPTAGLIGANSTFSVAQDNYYHKRPISCNIAISPQQQTPTSALSLETPGDEAATPVSATPTSGRKRARRFHGPAVSSAWPSSRNPRTGKLRGRPPQNCSVHDGPFSTFPANPQGKNLAADLEAGAAGIQASTSTPVVASSPQPPSLALANLRSQHPQLQILQRPSSRVSSAALMQPQLNGTVLKENSEYRELELRFATNLVQGVAFGLQVEDTKRIAQKVIYDLINHHTTKPELDFTPAIRVLLGCDEKTSALVKDFKVERLHSSGTSSANAQRDRSRPAEEQYKLSWKLKFGSLNGEFSQIVRLDNSSHIPSASDDPRPHLGELSLDGIGELQHINYGSENDNSAGLRRGHSWAIGGPYSLDSASLAHDWKKKYHEMEEHLKQKEEEIAQMKRRVLNAIMK